MNVPSAPENASQTEAEKQLDERNFNPEHGWRPALGYDHDKKGWQRLWLRFATDKDQKKEDTKPENSRFYKYTAGQKRRKIAEVHVAKKTRIIEAKKAHNLMRRDIKKANRERRRQRDHSGSDASDASGDNSGDDREDRESNENK